jgi:hypothetical protein
LSRRIADLLATLDDLAEDLRAELDRLAEAALEDAPRDEEVGQRQDVNREAAERHLADLVSDLKRETSLASLAFELRREFGEEIAKGWFGHGSFKNLLNAAVPNVQIRPDPPSYVLPPVLPPRNG